MSYGLMTINPQKYEITKVEFNKTYPIIITAINPDSTLYDVQIMVNKDSYYLYKDIKIEPTQFQIQPNDKKNIMLSITIPNTISPEEHELYLDFISGRTNLGKFKLSFKVPGEKNEKLVIYDADANMPEHEKNIYFNFKLKNDGNVIVHANPIIEIIENGEVIQTFGQESNIMILPGDDYNLTLLYDRINLLPGDYSFRAKFQYNDLETEPVTGDFTIKEENQQDYDYVIDQKKDEPIIIDLKLDNPNEELSFYKIEYNIYEKGIHNMLEGQTQTRNKKITLEIPTEGLASGSYIVDIKISQGRELEKTENKKVLVVIKDEKNWLLLLFLIIGGLTLGVLLYFTIPLLLKKRFNLGLEIEKLYKKYTMLEKDANAFSVDIHNFVNQSNNWLNRNGFGQYGFR